MALNTSILPRMSERIKISILLVITAIAIVGALFVPAFPQDIAYHTFFDQRSYYGISNFWNVVSNLPFLIVGLLGFRLVRRQSQSYYIKQNRISYSLFALGITLTAFGSTYYHLQPANNTLLWDRLPMSLAFMSFFCIVISDYLSQSFASKILFPLVILAGACVIYWHYTESIGAGDLRFYILVQFLPLVLISLVLVMFDHQTLRSNMIWSALGMYILAKVLEVYDQKIYEILGLVSGHTLKHLAAAVGAYYLIARAEILAIVKSTPPRAHY